MLRRKEVLYINDDPSSAFTCTERISNCREEMWEEKESCKFQAKSLKATNNSYTQQGLLRGFAPSEKPLLKLASPWSTDRYLEYFCHRTWQWELQCDSCWIWNDYFVACFLNTASQESNPGLCGFNVQRPPLTFKPFCCKDPTLSAGMGNSCNQLIAWVGKGCKREKGNTQRRKWPAQYPKRCQAPLSLWHHHQICLWFPGQWQENFGVLQANEPEKSVVEGMFLQMACLSH